MKECPNCGAQARDEWVRCPSCRANMLEAAVRLGRDRYVAPGETAPSGPPDLAAYELPRRSPVATAAARARLPATAAPFALWGGSTLLFVSLSCPSATGFGRSLAFSDGLPGLAILVVGIALLGAAILRRPVAAMIAAAVGIVVVGISWALLAISPYDAGWGWLVLGAGTALSMVGANAWLDALKAGAPSADRGAAR